MRMLCSTKNGTEKGDGDTMTAPGIENIIVVGGGLQGCGIATLFARAGIGVVLYHPRPSAPRYRPDGVSVTDTLPTQAPDLIVESVPEVLDTKIEMFRRMEEAYGDRPILASNTSGLPLEDMAAALERPERFLGMHFFTPAEVSPLVEVIRVAATDVEALTRVEAVLARAGRDALMVSSPVVGYIWNRLQHALLHEAYYLIEHDIARPEDIDAVARRLFGPRFCVTGLIESKDIGGLAMHADAQDAIVPHLNASRVASPILRRMVEKGDIGLRSGRGFYDWRGRDADAVMATNADKLRRLNAFLESEDD
jgi:3-hydroxybutyryl-CoA dehydrogenase